MVIDTEEFWCAHWDGFKKKNRWIESDDGGPTENTGVLAG